MLPVLMFFPFIIGCLAFIIKPKSLWVIPVCYGAMLAFVGWECYLMQIAEISDMYYSIPFMSIDEKLLNFEYKHDFMSILGGVMVLGVSFATLVYALDYPNDKSKNKVFGQICFLSAMMFWVIFSANVMVLYIGLYGMTVLIYFIINSKTDKTETANAAIKSFIINNIGDIFFLFGLIMLFVITGFTSLDDIFNSIGIVDEKFINIISVFLLIGVFAKSAQYGFHVWIVEAVIARNAVNALLYSATMIIAGAYAVIKMFLIFEIAENALLLMTWIGLFTCVYGAMLSCVQNGIKRVAAYATISQIGMVFVLLGLGYPMVAMLFLLMFSVHNSLLFMNVGIIIKGLSLEQDVNKMGGVYKYMPIAYVFMLICVIAINYAMFVAVNCIANSIEKNMQDYLLMLGGYLALFFTAGYSTRLFIKIFHGTQKEEDAILARINEKNPRMIIAITILVAMGIGIHYIKDWIVFEAAPMNMFFPLGLIAIAIGIISAIYSGKISSLIAVKKIVNDRRDFEELYNYLFVLPFKWLGKFFSITIDKNVIGGCEKAIAKMSRKISLYHENNGSRYEISMFVILLGFLGMILYSVMNGGVK